MYHLYLCCAITINSVCNTVQRFLYNLIMISLACAGCHVTFEDPAAYYHLTYDSSQLTEAIDANWHHVYNVH